MSRRRELVFRVVADISDEEICKVCKGKGSIVVRGAVCTEPLERTETCPRCGGRGRTSSGSRSRWRFWRRR
ncbi:MAG TPA: hypothetical protein PLM24_05705 [Methanothrix sp.]|nr:hypothetical protein [Methanothrix sp.]HPJ83670.1 hypothetical protein [Methanothrix sp.]HPR66615.1 hypothetical protein [Methanothrix sp.]